MGVSGLHDHEPRGVQRVTEFRERHQRDVMQRMPRRFAERPRIVMEERAPKNRTRRIRAEPMLGVVSTSVPPASARDGISLRYAKGFSRCSIPSTDSAASNESSSPRQRQGQVGRVNAPPRRAAASASMSAPSASRALRAQRRDEQAGAARRVEHAGATREAERANATRDRLLNDGQFVAHRTWYKIPQWTRWS
jgi:hypothetical protein